MIKRVGLAVVLIALQLPATSARSESDCGDYRLDEPGGPFAKIPVYNQEKIPGEDLSICYAIASAEIYDAYRFGKGDPLTKLSSPLSIHAKHQQSEMFDPDQPDFFNKGGQVFAALRRNNNSRICDQNFLEGIFPLADPSNQLSSASTNISLKTRVASLLAAIQERRKQLTTLASGIERLQNDNEECDLSADLPVDLKNLANIGRAIDAAAKLNMPSAQMSAAFGELCRGHDFVAQIPDPRTYNGWVNPDGTRASSDAGFYRNRKQKLASLMTPTGTRFPIGISYIPSMLFGDTNEDQFATHASVIIGGRSNNGECEVLVRNSYGVKCEAESHVSNLRYPCENGSLWIPRGILLKFVREFTWIQD